MARPQSEELKLHIGFMVIKPFATGTKRPSFTPGYHPSKDNPISKHYLLVMFTYERFTRNNNPRQIINEVLYV